MQITGWGLTETPIYDEKHYLINDPKVSRQLKLGYVRDRILKGTPLGGDKLCPGHQNYKICVYNLTLVLNTVCATFLPMFFDFNLLVYSSKKGSPNLRVAR